MTTASSAPVDPAARLLAFAARLRRRFAARFARDVALHVVLVLAGPAIVIAWCLPARLPLVAALLLGLAAAAWLAAYARARAVRERLLWRSAPALGEDAAFVDTAARATFGDELSTWLECQRGVREREAMVGWLGRDVVARLPEVAPAQLRRAGRRPLGRLRWLLPIVLVLLLAWLLSLWLAPPWAGAQRASGSNAGQGSGAGEGDGQGAGAGGQGGGALQPEPEPKDADSEPSKTAPPPPPPPPPRDEPKASEPPQPEPPAPLLELPEQQRFVVPEFFGDGPTRRVRMRAAAAGDEAAPPPGEAQRPNGTGSGEAPPLPPPSAETFAHAAEQAQQARHVPDEERAMVRRFFELLREAAK